VSSTCTCRIGHGPELGSSHGKRGGGGKTAECNCKCVDLILTMLVLTKYGKIMVAYLSPKNSLYSYRTRDHMQVNKIVTINCKLQTLCVRRVWGISTSDVTFFSLKVLVLLVIDHTTCAELGLTFCVVILLVQSNNSSANFYLRYGQNSLPNSLCALARLLRICHPWNITQWYVNSMDACIDCKYNPFNHSIPVSIQWNEADLPKRRYSM